MKQAIGAFCVVVIIGALHSAGAQEPPLCPPPQERLLGNCLCKNLDGTLSGTGTTCDATRLVAPPPPEDGDILYRSSSGSYIGIKRGPKGSVLCFTKDGSPQWVFPFELSKCDGVKSP
jgi:hypothetical protein